MTDLETNLCSVQDRIAAAAYRAKRHPSEIALVAVSKAQPVELIQAAYGLGLRDFGENRIEEAEVKAASTPVDIRWHMIGHIQSRKASRVPPLFGLVHSVDSMRLALRLDRLCAERREPLPILLEMNASGESSKYGFPAARWFEDRYERQAVLEQIERIVALSHVRVKGLMTMAPIVKQPEHARPVFSLVRRLRDDLRQAFPEADWHHLSMGMTDDFEVAVAEGATLVRIGRAIFAPHQAPIAVTLR